MENYIIQNGSLENLFDALVAGGKTMIAPRLKNGKILFGKVESFSEISQDFIQTAQSAKEAFFPRTEKLFGYTCSKNKIVLEDVDPEMFPEVILWGIRPCDAKSLVPLKKIFNWDTEDQIFNRRVEKTTVISFSCQQSDEFCFCTSAGGGPGSTEGSDILFTVMGTDGYMAEVLTEKGKQILDLNSGLFSKAESHTNKDQFLAAIPVRFSREEVSKKLASYFDSGIWENQSLRCMGCGACAFVCPSCACFDIQDESHGNRGTRLRCWDSCGFSLFTQHTSGHNPREKQSQRWRQRLLHKFAYMPERLSVYGCTGCGRCSRACPVDMNILQHLISIQEVDHA